MKKRIIIRESDIHRLVKEAINEISMDVKSNAYAKSERGHYDLERAMKAIEDIRVALSNYNGYDAEQCEIYIDYIVDFLERKNRQYYNIQGNFEDGRNNAKKRLNQLSNELFNMNFDELNDEQSNELYNSIDKNDKDLIWAFDNF